MVVLSHLSFRMPGFKRLLDSRYVSPVKNNSALFRAGNFCKAKDKKGGAGKQSSRYQSHQGDKYATPDSTRGRVDDGPLRADHRRLFMLFWAARASDVLITRAPEDSGACPGQPPQPTRLPSPQT